MEPVNNSTFPSSGCNRNSPLFPFPFFLCPWHCSSICPGWDLGKESRNCPQVLEEPQQTPNSAPWTPKNCCTSGPAMATREVEGIYGFFTAFRPKLLKFSEHFGSTRRSQAMTKSSSSTFQRDSDSALAVSTAWILQDYMEISSFSI